MHVLIKGWFIMTQGFALRCIATGSAYKMIWTATQRRNRKNFYPCVASPSNHFICTSGHDATQRNPCVISLRHVCALSVTDPKCLYNSYSRTAKYIEKHTVLLMQTPLIDFSSSKYFGQACPIAKVAGKLLAGAHSVNFDV